MIRLSRVCVAVAVVLALASAGSGRQPGLAEVREERKRALFDGTHVFRRILHDHDFRPLRSFAELTNNPESTLLVVLGDLDVLGDVPGGLDTFVRSGGALLAASDRPLLDRTARNQLLGVSGVSINTETLVVHDPDLTYHAKPYCPIVRPVPRAQPALFRNEGDGETTLEVYTNVPSKLLLRRRPPPRVQAIAALPLGSQVELPGGRRQAELGWPLFAVAGTVGAGKVLVLADHSVFINQMMLPRDTGNVEFSYNAIRWLQGENRRDRVLFVEDGRIEEQLEIPLRSVSLPAEEALNLLFARRNEILVEAENILAGLEDDDAFNRALVDRLERSSVPPERLFALLAVLGTLLALLWLVYRVGIRGRFSHDTSVPLLAPAVGRNLPAVPLTEQRREALLKGRNLWEPAATLVRRWFARQGLEPGAGETRPRFEVAGSWWRRWWLSRRLHQLWRLAQGRSPKPVTPAELWRLQRELERLEAERQRGTWRIAGPGTATLNQRDLVDRAATRGQHDRQPGGVSSG